MCNHQTTYLACKSTNKPENAQMCTFEHFITHVHILNIYTHICTTMQICTYMHDVHSGTNTPHAWLISVRRVSNISGASDGPPQLPKSDFGKLKPLAPLLLLVSEMTSQRSDFIIVSFIVTVLWRVIRILLLVRFIVGLSLKVSPNFRIFWIILVTIIQLSLGKLL